MGALVLLFAAAPALAGDLFINGVRAEGIRDIELEEVDVRFDSEGNIYILAPQYDIEIVASPPDVEGPSIELANDVTLPTPPSATVEPGRWWLVTEDAGSVGQVVEVSIQGRRVTTVRSAQETAYIDLHDYLQVGDNEISFIASAEAPLSGGVLHIYLGGVVDDEGSLAMPEPAIDYARRASSSITGAPETFILSIPSAIP